MTRNFAPWLRSAAMAAALLLGLGGCGGGGGGSDSSAVESDNRFSVSFDRAEVSIDYNEGANATTATVQATGTGDASGGLYVGATTPSGQPDPRIKQVDINIDVPRQAATVVVRPNADLAPGTHRGELLLMACPNNTCSKHYRGSPFKLSYTIVVHPLIRVSAVNTATMGSDSSPEGLRGAIAVTATAVQGSSGGSWTATSTAPWLRLVRSQGEFGSSIEYQIDASAALALPAYQDHDAVIELAEKAGAGAIGFVPTRTTLRFRRELAEVHFSGPGSIMAGKATTVIVRGRGFQHLADPLARVSVGPVRPSSVRRLSPTALELQLPPLPAGKHSIGVSNAYSIAAPSGSLDAVAPRSFAAESVAATGGPRSLIYDPVRQTAYSVRTDGPQATIWRLRLGGQRAVVDTLPIAGLIDIGLSPDGSTLIAADAQGVHLIDAASFRVVSRHTYPGGVLSTSHTTQGIAVTNDGKAWLAGGQYAHCNALTFDLRERTFLVIEAPGVLTGCYGGPWYAVSRNGERLMLVQGSAISPSPPMLYMDASDGTLRVNPVQLGFFYNKTSLGDTGNRFLVSGNWIYDRNFQLLSQIDIFAWPGETQTASVLSPSGMRAYVLALQIVGSKATARIRVLDTSVAASAPPVLGTIEGPALRDCNYDDSTQNCYLNAITVTSDGNNLLWASASQFHVVPIPAGLRDPTP
jgi:hypothetical protein